MTRSRWLLAALPAAALALAACGSAAEPAGEGSSGATEERRDSRRASDGGFVEFRDPEVGVSGAHPAGWHRARALTNLIVPREVLALASYPLRGGSKGGGCAPETARSDMPPGGTFVWLLEYRPTRGDPWAEVPRERFPPRPGRFRLAREDLGENLYCFLGPGYTTTFRASDRPLQLLVAFGGRPTDEQLARVEAVLDALELDPLPPPPPDPYAGWPLINDAAGDSLRPPPGWPAAVATFERGATASPRPLFFPSNRPLFGLPPKLVPAAVELPGPMPSAALANGFPADGVLLWVIEEGERSQIGARFSAIGREWPSRADFAPEAVLTKAAPEARWLHAGGEFGHHRFSVWIARGPRATAEDVELALKSASSLAVSGCRGAPGDACPDE